MQIVARQISGLGNQMFQYAAGRYYESQYEASMRLALDPPERSFSYESPRPFLLNRFCITAPAATISIADKFYLSHRTGVRQLAAVAKSVLRIAVRQESLSERHTFIHDLAVPRDLRALYLVGYWQTYRIAQAVESDLRSEFAFREPATGKNLEILQQIQTAPVAVAIHIRRGDYTLAAEGNRVLPMAYYDQAIRLLRQQFVDPTFFVFSDDPFFAENNLPAGLNAVFVNHNDDAMAHEDLRLMSRCSHHIIANSSFSWWGAWLNPSSDKIVYAPRQWLMTPESYFPDLMPPSWRLLDVV